MRAASLAVRALQALVKKLPPIRTHAAVVLLVVVPFVYASPVWAQTAGSTPVARADGLKATLEFVELLMKIIAYLVGALWVYFNFLKGRTYEPRLEVTVTGSRWPTLLSRVVHVVVRVKNVGLSKVPIVQEGTAVRILAAEDDDDIAFERLATLSILQDHEWIEPGETVEDQTVWPAELSATGIVRVEASVRSHKKMWKSMSMLLSSAVGGTAHPEPELVGLVRPEEGSRTPKRGEAMSKDDTRSSVDARLRSGNRRDDMVVQQKQIDPEEVKRIEAEKKASTGTASGGAGKTKKSGKS